MRHLILAINPGSTSTKVALFEGNQLCKAEELEPLNIGYIKV